VLCELVGLPRSEQAQAIEWTWLLENPNSAGLSVEQIEGIIDQLYGYLRSLVAQRRAKPTGDFISALLNVEEGGDRLSEDELLNACFVLLTSGYESTMNLIGNAVLTLLRHPDQLAPVQAKPELLPKAIEEVLRYEGPSLLVIRSVAEPVEIAGGRLEEGELVYLLLGSANRDPARFPAPDRFDIARSDNKHVSFGVGIHFCLGAPLARLEAEVALAALLRRFPHLRLETDAAEWRTNRALRGLVSLPVAY
jgi:cytochrome P450